MHCMLDEIVAFLSFVLPVALKKPPHMWFGLSAEDHLLWLSVVVTFCCGFVPEMGREVFWLTADIANKSPFEFARMWFTCT